MSEPLDNDAKATGVICKRCGCMHSHVIYTRHRRYTIGGNVYVKTVRRRECRHCGHRFHTSERAT